MLINVTVDIRATVLRKPSGSDPQYSKMYQLNATEAHEMHVIKVTNTSVGTFLMH